jgi:Sensors of blue-light using FAD
MSNCFTLAYQSLSTNLLTLEAFLEMLVQARRFNAENDITGLLLIGNGRILQLLEGPEAEVRALYERIELDPLHTAVTLLSTATATQREFPDWSMAYVRPTDGDGQVGECAVLDVHRLEFILGCDEKLFYFKPASAALITTWLTGL